MNVNELIEKLVPFLPDVYADEDMDGELVLYTNLKITDNDMLVPFEPED